MGPAEYLDALVERLHALLGADLVGVYAGGSFALGGYLPGRSDLDVTVVCRRALGDEEKAELGSALRHEAFPCPARGLELVVYREESVRSGTGEPGYELNLNTGRAMPSVLSFSPEGDEHWYAIDRAIVREHGVTLVGPPPHELFAAIARDVLLERLVESVRWHAGHDEAARDDAVLNACRAWRFAREGVWSSKPDAGRWVLARARAPVAVAGALEARTGRGAIGSDTAGAFLHEVLVALEEARGRGSLHP